MCFGSAAIPIAEAAPIALAVANDLPVRLVAYVEAHPGMLKDASFATEATGTREEWLVPRWSNTRTRNCRA